MYLGGLLDDAEVLHARMPAATPGCSAAYAAAAPPPPQTPYAAPTPPLPLSGITYGAALRASRACRHNRLRWLPHTGLNRVAAMRSKKGEEHCAAGPLLRLTPRGRPIQPGAMPRAGVGAATTAGRRRPRPFWTGGRTRWWRRPRQLASPRALLSGRRRPPGASTAPLPARDTGCCLTCDRQRNIPPRAGRLSVCDGGLWPWQPPSACLNIWPACSRQPVTWPACAIARSARRPCSSCAVSAVQRGRAVCCCLASRMPRR